MATSLIDSSEESFQLEKNTWEHLYPKLQHSIRKAMYILRIPAWYGQEEDLCEDIVQETLLRLLERLHRVEQGQASAIVSLERLGYMVAFNYTRDLRRRDRRLVHAFSEDFMEQELVSSLEEATENVYEEMLFGLLAQIVVQLPQKQREALLSDLATRMSFEAIPTPLQAAFLRQAIDLKTYQQKLPSTPEERSRQSALLRHAYKRLLRNLAAGSYLEA